ncbi:DUF2285 domain-containing protein [Brevundimonas aurifodinae]|uniref:DUF2285 domain-containing protein n=1 Tax=Brevundimonas aurifodinae TaxID=1508312 RepID=A0ABV1NNB2_9CAUL
MGADDPPPILDKVADDGRHLRLGDPLCAARLVIAPLPAPDDRPLAILPLDDHLMLRVEAVQALWRILSGRPSGRRAALTKQRRRRLAQALRAADAKIAGATRREIAVALFGPRAVPAGQAFDDHHLKSRAARLVRDGLAMIAGGYRNLLTPSH